MVILSRPVFGARTQRGLGRGAAIILALLVMVGSGSSVTPAAQGRAVEREASPAAPLSQSQVAPRPPIVVTILPDLVVTNVSTTQLGNCQRLVKVTIKNTPLVSQLGAAVGAFNVALLSSGRVADLESVSGLGVGKSVTVNLYGSGETTEWVSVDWGNKKKERSETNNTSAKRIIVC